MYKGWLRISLLWNHIINDLNISHLFNLNLSAFGNKCKMCMHSNGYIFNDTASDAKYIQNISMPCSMPCSSDVASEPFATSLEHGSVVM